MEMRNEMIEEIETARELATHAELKTSKHPQMDMEINLSKTWKKSSNLFKVSKRPCLKLVADGNTYGCWWIC